MNMYYGFSKFHWANENGLDHLRNFGWSLFLQSESVHFYRPMYATMNEQKPQSVSFLRSKLEFELELTAEWIVASNFN